MAIDDTRARAILTTALHPSSSPNERLMALDAFARIMARAGLHPNDLRIYDASTTAAPSPRVAAEAEALARLETALAAAARRVKALESANRRLMRELAGRDRTIAEQAAALDAAEIAAGEDAVQIAALEADLLARDRTIAERAVGRSADCNAG